MELTPRIHDLVTAGAVLEVELRVIPIQFPR
jgi:hypothetical protein